MDFFVVMLNGNENNETILKPSPP